MQAFAQHGHGVARGKAEVAELLGGALADVEVVAGKLADEIRDSGGFTLFAGRAAHAGRHRHRHGDRVTHEEPPRSEWFSSPYSSLCGSAAEV